MKKNKEKFQHLIPTILCYCSFRFYNLDTFTYFFNCQDKQSPKFIEKIPILLTNICHNNHIKLLIMLCTINKKINKIIYNNLFEKIVFYYRNKEYEKIYEYLNQFLYNYSKKDYMKDIKFRDKCFINVCAKRNICNIKIIK